MPTDPLFPLISGPCYLFIIIQSFKIPVIFLEALLTALHMESQDKTRYFIKYNSEVRIRCGLRCLSFTTFPIFPLLTNVPMGIIIDAD